MLQQTKRTTKANDKDIEVQSYKSRVSRSSRSSLSRQSSSVALAHADAVAKKAELLARARALKKKQALQKEALRLQHQQEQLEFEVEMVVADARIWALDEVSEGLSLKDVMVDSINTHEGNEYVY